MTTKPIPPATVEFSGQPIAAGELAQLAARLLVPYPGHAAGEVGQLSHFHTQPGGQRIARLSSGKAYPVTVRIEDVGQA